MLVKETTSRDFLTNRNLRRRLPSEKGAMKKSRYSDEQIVRILRDADKKPAPAAARRHGVCGQSLRGWGKRIASMAADEITALEQLA